jgi:Multiubiquitin
MNDNNTKPKQAETAEFLVDEVDLEQFAKEGKNPPKAKVYRIRVDKEHFKVPHPSRTGREILVIAGKQPPESFILTQKMRGGVVKTIELSDVVDFTTPGIERFNTLPREVTEG